jgi:hypothetical protein
MEGFKKIVVLQSFDEAEVMGIVLKQCGIPHRIRSYHDSALDGIFQITKGWGHVEAPEEYRDQIKEIHAGLPGEPSRDGKKRQTRLTTRKTLRDFSYPWIARLI